MLGASAYASEFATGERLRLEESVAYAIEDKVPAVPNTARVEGRANQLARREVGVGRLVAEGLTNKEIASRLYLSDRTVESHVRHILNKLGLASRVQIASWFSRDESRAAPTSLR
jgi:DNA-binding NarL/FixJ family response regulator